MNYRLYDFHTNECLLTDVDRHKVAEYTGMNINSVTQYAKSGRVYKEKYTVKRIDTNTQKIKKTKFEKEWDETVSLFKRVKWVKSGGRKLEFKR